MKNQVQVGDRIEFKVGEYSKETNIGTVVQIKENRITVGLANQGTYTWSFEEEESKKYGFKYGWYVAASWVTKVILDPPRVGDRIEFRTPQETTLRGTVLKVTKNLGILVGRTVKDDYSWEFDPDEVDKYRFPYGYYIEESQIIRNSG